MATKVMMEALSPTMEEGRLVKWLKNEGDPSTPPQEKVAPRTPMPHADAHASEQAPHAADNGGRVLSSPLARRMAAEAGLELEQVRGSGPGGRIIRRDIEAAAAAPRAP